MATHSSILAWEIPWTEEPGRLQSMGWQSQTRLSNTTLPPRSRPKARTQMNSFTWEPLVMEQRREAGMKRKKLKVLLGASYCCGQLELKFMASSGSQEGTGLRLSQTTNRAAGHLFTYSQSCIEDGFQTTPSALLACPLPHHTHRLSRHSQQHALQVESQVCTGVLNVEVGTKSRRVKHRLCQLHPQRANYVTSKHKPRLTSQEGSFQPVWFIFSSKQDMLPPTILNDLNNSGSTSQRQNTVEGYPVPIPQLYIQLVVLTSGLSPQHSWWTGTSSLLAIQETPYNRIL